MKRILWVILVSMLAVGCTGAEQRTSPIAESPRRLRSDAIQPPSLLAAVNRTRGEVHLYWKAPDNTTGIDAYQIYGRKGEEAFSLWKTIPADGIGDAVQTASLVNLATDEVMYFQMISTGKQSSLESKPTRALAVRLKEGKSRCIIVAGRDSEVSPSEKDSQIFLRYGESMQRIGKAFDSCLAEALPGGQKEVLTLDEYEQVIWSSGTNAKDPLSESERTILLNHLNEGGDLFISGSGLAQALSGKNASEAEQEFYRYYLRAFFDLQWSKISEPVRSLQGCEENRYFRDLTIHLKPEEGVVPYARVEPYGGSDPALYYSNLDEPNIAAVTYVGTFETPNHFSRLVYLAIPWEGIHFQDARTELLRRALDYCENAGPLRYVSLVRGTITDAVSGEPLNEVGIHLLGGTNYLGIPVETTTNPDGTFRMVALEGTYHLEIEKEGYQTIRLRNVSIRRNIPYVINQALRPSN